MIIKFMVKHIQYFRMIMVLINILNKYLKHIFKISILVLMGHVYAGSDAMNGWYFYDDPRLIIKATKNNDQKTYKGYSQYNEALKNEFEEIQDKAIYDPTPENIKAYNVALRMISNNAVKFGLLSVTQNWQDPNSGSSVSAPNGAGLQHDLDNQRQQISQIVKRFAIFYFVSKDCKYCSIEANELKRMEYAYNISVRVISMDGYSVPQYPNPTPDTGISKKLQVKEPGEILVFDSSNNKTTVLGFGYIHFDQIIQRIQTLFITGTANWDQYLTQSQPILINREFGGK
ncbi:MAG: conjugal transfer protein TraF [Burkholderiales bacterium]|nr:conjugal transfer protein TraF [Burkholderiales bacterium]